MKAFLANIIMLLMIILAYKFNLFAIMAHKSALIIAIVVVGIIFIVALKIRGNPLKREDNSHDQN